jgi:hypothetical protein
MDSLVFRCPTTGMNVQGWIVDDPSARKAETYEAVSCLACTRLHLVNPKTGKVMGSR